MRILYSILLLLLCKFSFAQFTPFAGLEAYSNSNIRLVPAISVLHGVKYNTGDLAMIYGLSYQFKNVELSTSAKTSMHVVSATAYKPTHTEFAISAAYQLKDFKIKLEHMCIHPMESYRDNPVKIFGGYTKLCIYWNYKP